MLITSVYRISPPDPKFAKIYKRKVAAVIELMGDKYLLAKPVERIKPNGKY